MVNEVYLKVFQELKPLKCIFLNRLLSCCRLRN